jgi:hypothetical protein
VSEREREKERQRHRKKKKREKLLGIGTARQKGVIGYLHAKHLLTHSGQTVENVSQRKVLSESSSV